MTLLLLVLAIACSAQSVGMPAVEPHTERNFITQGFSVLEDPRGVWSFDSLLSADRNHPSSVPWKEGESTLGHSSSVFWIKLHLHNPDLSESEWTLALADTFPPVADFFVVGGDGRLVKAVRAGAGTPGTARELDGLVAGVTMHLPRGEDTTTYLRLQTNSLLNCRMIFATGKGWRDFAFWRLVVICVYCGLVLCLFIYGLSMYMSLRDKCYLYYVCYVASTAATMARVSGLEARLAFLSPLWPYRFQMPGLQILALGTGILFAREFLDTRRTIPRTDRVLSVLQWGCAVVLALSFFEPAAAGEILDFSCILFVGITVAGCIASLRLGHRYVWYFLVAACIPFFVVSTWSLASLLHWPLYDLEFVVLGFGAELVLMATGLSARVAEMRRQLVDEKSRLGRLKDEFLTVASHELRTPITVIIGWASLLLEEGALPQEKRQALDAIQRSAEHELRLIESLLDVSNIVAGRLQLTVEAVDLVELLRETASVFDLSLRTKALQLDLPAIDRAVRISGDKGRLRQVIWNLLSNAVKFSGKGGRIRVELEQGEDRIRLAVEDEGAGISEEFLPYVFERFSQADSTYRRKHGGFGLGLALSRYLVELHGGAIHAQSAGEGRGARFTVDLPRSLPQS